MANNHANGEGMVRDLAPGGGDPGGEDDQSIPDIDMISVGSSIDGSEPEEEDPQNDPFQPVHHFLFLGQDEADMAFEAFGGDSDEEEEEEEEENVVHIVPILEAEEEEDECGR